MALVATSSSTPTRRFAFICRTGVALSETRTAPIVVRASGAGVPLIAPAASIESPAGNSAEIAKGGMPPVTAIAWA